MSAAVRQALAEACNAIDGVEVSPNFSSVTNPGTGMVRFGGLNRPNRLGGVVTWQVVIFLSRDIAQAEEWIDEHLAPVLDAIEQRRELHDGLRVDRQQLSLDDVGTVPIVLIEGTREEDS
jgi:hypothetical protein